MKFIPMRKIVISRSAGIAYGIASVIFLVAFLLIISQTAVAVGCALEVLAFAITFRVAATNGHVD